MCCPLSGCPPGTGPVHCSFSEHLFAYRTNGGPHMIDKLAPSVEAALQGTPDGATVMIGGFGGAGQPAELIDALIEQGARDLTIVNNNAGNGETGLAALLATGR